MRSHHPLAAGVAALGAALLLGGCFTGPRPSFIDISTDPTGDTAVDQVVAAMDTAPSGTFTATYEILAKYGNTTVAATVSRDDTRTSITIGDVRFLETADGTQTCAVSAGTCEPGLNDARVSDTPVLHTFAKEAAVARLRREASSQTAPGETFTATVGNQQVTCVRVTGAGGTTQFCALDNGWLALEDVAEAHVELKTLVPTATEALFTPSGV